MNIRTVLSRVSKAAASSRGRVICIVSVLVLSVAMGGYGAYGLITGLDDEKKGDTACVLSNAAPIPAEESFTETIETKTELIPFDTKIIDDPFMKKDEVKVIRKGTEGLQAVTYRTVYNNGVFVSRTQIQQTVIVPAEEARIRRGTGEGGYITTEDGTTLRYVKKLRLEATAYNKENTVDITAIGTKPKWGTVAIDRRVISLGTKVYVTSLDGEWAYGEGLCEDTGVIGQRIDLYMNSLSECFKFGRKDVYVYILG